MTTVLAALALSAATTPAFDAEAWLRAELPRRVPDIVRWDVGRVDGRPRVRVAHVERVELGIVGARTLLVLHGRDADGRPAVEHAWFRVAAWSRGSVAARTLAPREALDAAAIASGDVDRFRDECTPLPSAAAAAGLRTRTARAPGEPLCAELVEPLPAVEGGRVVTVYVRAGGVAVTTQARARTDAWLGDRVGLRRDDAGGEFTGRVTGRGEVTIDE